jgi:PDZ domain-containing secreted protein
VAIDDQDVTSSTDVSDAISTKEPGDEITVSWLDQSGEQHQATIELGTSPIA